MNVTRQRRGVALALAIAVIAPGFAAKAESMPDASIEQRSVQTIQIEPNSPRLTIKDLKVGSPVLGIDGVKIGEINRISTNSDGSLSEVHVTTGGPAGINAEVYAIKPDQIATNDAQSLKLKMSGADAKSLPVISGDS